MKRNPKKTPLCLTLAVSAAVLLGSCDKPAAVEAEAAAPTRSERRELRRAAQAEATAKQEMLAVYRIAVTSEDLSAAQKAALVDVYKKKHDAHFDQFPAWLAEFEALIKLEMALAFGLKVDGHLDELVDAMKQDGLLDASYTLKQ